MQAKWFLQDAVGLCVEKTAFRPQAGRSQRICVPEARDSQDWPLTFNWLKALPRELPDDGKQSRAYRRGNDPSMVLRQVMRGWESDFILVIYLSVFAAEIRTKPCVTCARQGVSRATFHF